MKKQRLEEIALIGLVALLALVMPIAWGADWKTNDHDLRGTRHNSDETTLDVSNVAQLVELKKVPVKGSIIKNAVIDRKSVFITSYVVEVATNLNGDNDVNGFDQSGIPRTFDDFASYVYKFDRDLNPVVGWNNPIDVASAFSECNPGKPVPPLILQTSPTLFKNKVILATGVVNQPIIPIGLPSGYLIALNKQSGRCLWTTLITTPPPDTEVECTSDANDQSKPSCYLAGYPYPYAFGIPNPDPFNIQPVITAKDDSHLVYRHVFEGIQSSPVVHDHFMYVATTSAEEEASAFIPGYPCCKTNPKVVMVDLNNGEIVWQKHLIDDELFSGKDSNDTQRFAGVTVYASPGVVLDLKNNRLILATGNAYRGDPAYCFTGDMRPACTSGTPLPHVSTIPIEKLPIDSLVAIDMEGNHDIKWALQAVPEDFWNFACLALPGIPDINLNNCPNPPGPDYNISSGPLLIRNVDNVNRIDVDGNGRIRRKIDIVLGKVKDGNVIAAEVITGKPVWKTAISNPSLFGLAGLSYDGDQVYATAENTFHTDFGTGQPTSRAWQMVGGPYGGSTIFGGNLSALDPATGEISWQSNAIQDVGVPWLPFTGNGVPVPTLDDLGGGADHLIPIDIYLGPPSSIPGVVFAESIFPSNELNVLLNFLPSPALPFPNGVLLPGPSMYAFDSYSGDVLWSFTATTDHPLLQSGSVVTAGPSIVDGKVYWGSGFAENDGYLYLFGLPQ